MDLAKFKEAFLSESRQHLATMNHALLQLEQSPGKVEWLSEISRALHTLKSIADTAQWGQTVALCHAMEDLLDRIKKRNVKLGDVVDPLFRCLDTLGASLRALERNEAELNTEELVKGLASKLPFDKLRVNGAVRGEFVEPRTEVAEKVRSIEVKVERMDLLMNLAEELLITRMRLEKIEEGLDHPELTAAVESLGRVVTETQYNVMQARMVPIGFVFQRFPRMVRDLAKQQGKQVNLEMAGEAIELDRAVVDEIGESLVHLLRNAVDHGMEPPEARRKAGKPPVGTIRVTATSTKEHAIIEVKDDGAGLSVEEIKEIGIARGILSPGAGAQEVMDSIFSGVSTTKQVTTVSGRGLGLSIVKKKIESLGGAVRVSFSPGQGCAFTLEIPLTLAIIKTLFVEVGKRTYAVPAAAIDRLVTVAPGQIKGLLEYEAIVLDGEDIPITRLSELFSARVPGLRPGTLALAAQPIVVIRRGAERMGLAVDNLLSTQEIVIKPLNKLVRANRYFAGSSIIGSGEVVLILDVNNLILAKRRKEQLV